MGTRIFAVMFIFIVTCFGSDISRRSRHFTQYASTPFLLCDGWTSGHSLECRTFGGL